MNKELFKKQFQSLYPKKRLLAIQLNGFTHIVYYDNGDKSSRVCFDSYSAYAPELHYSREVKELLGQFPHYTYQNNAQEIVFVYPNER